MPRPPRSALPDEGIYHLVSRGVGGVAIYLDDADRRRFSHLLGRVCSAFALPYHAHCLMTTHHHLLVEARLEAQLFRDCPSTIRGR